MARLLIGNFKGIKGDKGEKGDDGVIDSNSIISFEDYTNSTPPPTDMALGSIKTGKSISSLLSNIKALLMSTLTTSKLANNLNTNQEGFALDARMGKQLGDSVGAINDSLNNIAEYGHTDAVSGSVAASTWTPLQSVTLTKGTYILTGKMQVSPSSTGGVFAIRFGHESEYVSQVYHATFGMALEKTSHIIVGDEPVVVTLTGYATIVSNYNSVRIRWLKINKN